MVFTRDLAFGPWPQLRGICVCTAWTGLLRRWPDMRRSFRDRRIQYYVAFSRAHGAFARYRPLEQIVGCLQESEEAGRHKSQNDNTAPASVLAALCHLAESRSQSPLDHILSVYSSVADHILGRHSADRLSRISARVGRLTFMM